MTGDKATDGHTNTIIGNHHVETTHDLFRERRINIHLRKRYEQILVSSSRIRGELNTMQQESELISYIKYRLASEVDIESADVNEKEADVSTQIEMLFKRMKSAYQLDCSYLVFKMLLGDFKRFQIANNSHTNTSKSLLGCNQLLEPLKWITDLYCGEDINQIDERRLQMCAPQIWLDCRRIFLNLLWLIKCAEDDNYESIQQSIIEKLKTDRDGWIIQCQLITESHLKQTEGCGDVVAAYEQVNAMLEKRLLEKFDSV
eukprot:GHVH01003406.1.p1 GENE.GHVH01003406.1~~GHVH01003406.1.p1  ORF type:complete len:259 (-),score=30.57 GHVH01003406.1:326-1102(-)